MSTTEMKQQPTGSPATCAECGCASVATGGLPIAVWLDEPDDVIRFKTGRSASTLWRWKKEGLPLRQRGEGKTARHFVLVEDLIVFLRDTSIIVP
jgi:hypothetical protein